MRANDKKTLVEAIADEMYQEDGEVLLEMSNRWQEETLLPMIIWIDESQTYKNGKHGKLIKFQLNSSDNLNRIPWGEIDFSGKNHLKKSTPKHAVRLSAEQTTQLRNFVSNNKVALEQLADTTIRIHEIWNDIIKGGNPAFPELIQALNDKVAAQVAARRQNSQSAPPVATRVRSADSGNFIGGLFGFWSN